MTPIFVFGSNLAGRHGGGAARHALDHCGAVYGQGIGLQGSSYGIPTKDFAIETLPLDSIAEYVTGFLTFARRRSDLSFLVTAIGCGLAGLDARDIAPMFAGATENVFLSAKLVEGLR